jgi:uncharacterized membrane protein HdeD (DUF308 family)
LVALRGLAAVIFGIVAFAWPGITLEALMIVFGAYAVVGGAFTVGAALAGDSSDKWWYVLEGILSIAVGVIAWLFPGVTALTLVLLISALAIITGILEVVAAIGLRKVISNEWVMVLSGLASVVFGVLIAIWPREGALAIIWVIGAYAIVFGALLIVLGFRLRSVGHDLERAMSGTPFSGGAAKPA